MGMDVIMNKCAIMERCVKRVSDEYAGDPASLENITKQDAMILNILRACEAAIDLAMHIVAECSLGVPQSSRDAVDMLQQHAFITVDSALAIKNMIGFRNVAVHDYQALNLTIVQAVIERHLTDFSRYASEVRHSTLGAKGRFKDAEETDCFI